MSGLPPSAPARQRASLSAQTARRRGEAYHGLSLLAGLDALVRRISTRAPLDAARSTVPVAKEEVRAIIFGGVGGEGR